MASRIASGNLWDKAADQGGVQAVTKVTVTVPGGDPVALTHLACTVTQNLDLGVRWQADVEVMRVPRQSTWDLVTTPGAIFAIDHGWDFGAGVIDTRPFGRYELAAAPKADRDESISLSLVDQWKRLEECRFTTPGMVTPGYIRSSFIAGFVLPVMPGTPFDVRATGGTTGVAATWDTDRTEAINDLARDGGILAHFSGDGTFVIEREPSITPASPSLVLTDGERANIIDLSREQVFTRLYNAVTVRPTGDFSWDPVTVSLSDSSHPRHQSKIGLRPFFYSSPLIADRTAAAATGRTLLPRVINALERVEVTTWARGHVQPGQTFSTIEAASPTDPQQSGIYLVETVVHDCLSLETTITGRSTAGVQMEES